MERVQSVLLDRLLAAVRGFLGIDNSEAVARLITERLRETFLDYLPVANAHAAAHLIEAEGEIMARLIEAKAELIKAEAFADLVKSSAPVCTVEADIFSHCEDELNTPSELDIVRALGLLRGLLAEHIEDYEMRIENPLLKSFPHPSNAAGPNVH